MEPNNQAGALVNLALINNLIIGLQFHPTSWAPTQDKATNLIIDEDKEGEGKSRQPPEEFEGVHTQTLVHAWCIGKEGSQCGLKDQTKVQHPVLHALVDDGVTAGLADD